MPDPPQSDSPHLRISYPENAPEGVIARFEFSPGDDEWTASGDVIRGASGLVISRLELHPDPSSTSGITGSLLRKVQVGELLSAIRAEVSRGPAKTSQAPSTAEPEDREQTQPRRGGRAILTDELLRDIAVAYLIETAPGQPSGAVKRMAERFGRPEETIRTWVARARRNGWLGPSVKGRAGAEPGPRLDDVSVEEMGRIYPGLIEHVVVHKNGTAEDVSIKPAKD